MNKKILSLPLITILLASLVLASTCGNITQSITLDSNVQSNGNCFVFKNHNLTLDCNGFMINHSATSGGYGISADAAGMNNLTIKNCIITSSNKALNGIGSIFLGGSNILIYNNTFKPMFDNIDTMSYVIQLSGPVEGSDASRPYVIANNNFIYVAKRNYLNGIYASSASMIIENNTFSIGSYNNSNTVVRAIEFINRANNSIIKNNSFNMYGATSSEITALRIEDAREVEVFNNRFNHSSTTSTSGFLINVNNYNYKIKIFNNSFLTTRRAISVSQGYNISILNNVIKQTAGTGNNLISFSGVAHNVTVENNFISTTGANTVQAISLNMGGSNMHNISVNNNTIKLGSGTNTIGIYTALGALSTGINVTSNRVLFEAGSGTGTGYSLVSLNPRVLFKDNTFTSSKTTSAGYAIQLTTNANCSVVNFFTNGTQYITTDASSNATFVNFTILNGTNSLTINSFAVNKTVMTWDNTRTRLGLNYSYVNQSYWSNKFNTSLKIILTSNNFTDKPEVLYAREDNTTQNECSDCEVLFANSTVVIFNTYRGGVYSIGYNDTLPPTLPTPSVELMYLSSTTPWSDCSGLGNNINCANTTDHSPTFKIKLSGPANDVIMSLDPVNYTSATRYSNCTKTEVLNWSCTWQMPPMEDDTFNDFFFLVNTSDGRITETPIRKNNTVRIYVLEEHFNSIPRLITLSDYYNSSVLQNSSWWQENCTYDNNTWTGCVNSTMINVTVRIKNGSDFQVILGNTKNWLVPRTQFGWNAWYNNNMIIIDKNRCDAEGRKPISKLEGCKYRLVPYDQPSNDSLLYYDYGDYDYDMRPLIEVDKK